MAPPPKLTGRTSGLVSTPSWTAGWSSARRSRSRSKANSSSSRKRPRRPAADIADPLRTSDVGGELLGEEGRRWPVHGAQVVLGHGRRELLVCRRRVRGAAGHYGHAGGAGAHNEGTDLGPGLRIRPLPGWARRDVRAVRAGTRRTRDQVIPNRVRTRATGPGPYTGPRPGWS